MSIVDTIMNTSIEMIIMALIVFGFTMLIKIPIKKKTSEFSENKRKLWNSLIILIPFLVSLIVSIGYSCIFLRCIKIGALFDLSISVYVLALTIYAIYSRIIIIIQGFKSGDINLEECVGQAKDVLTLDINNMVSKEEEELIDVVNQIKALISEKELLTNAEGQVSLSTIASTNIKIQSLQEKKKKLENLIKKEKEMGIKGE